MYRVIYNNFRHTFVRYVGGTGRATLEVQLGGLAAELTSLRDLQQRLVRDKDTDLRRLKKTQLSVKQSDDSLHNLTQTLASRRADVRLSTYSYSTCTLPVPCSNGVPVVVSTHHRTSRVN